MTKLNFYICNHISDFHDSDDKLYNAVKDRHLKECTYCYDKYFEFKKQSRLSALTPDTIMTKLNLSPRKKKYKVYKPKNDIKPGDIMYLHNKIVFRDNDDINYLFYDFESSLALVLQKIDEYIQIAPIIVDGDFNPDLDIVVKESKLFTTSSYTIYPWFYTSILNELIGPVVDYIDLNKITDELEYKVNMPVEDNKTFKRYMKNTSEQLLDELEQITEFISQSMTFYNTENLVIVKDYNSIFESAMKNNKFVDNKIKMLKPNIINLQKPVLMAAADENVEIPKEMLYNGDEIHIKIMKVGKKMKFECHSDKENIEFQVIADDKIVPYEDKTFANNIITYTYSHILPDFNVKFLDGTNKIELTVSFRTYPALS